MPARRRLQSVASALLLAGLAAGAAACGSSSSGAAAQPGGGATSTTERVSGTGVVSAPSGNSPDPCTIVSAAEVEAIAGVPAATPSGPKSENRGRTCTWNPGNGTSVLVQVFQGKEFYDPSMQAPKATKLSGIGDDAYLDAFGTTRAAVGFLKGDTAVFIDGLQVTSADAVVAAARDAASKV